MLRYLPVPRSTSIDENGSCNAPDTAAGGRDTAVSGKVFLGKLYPPRARGPSTLAFIAQPLLLSYRIPDSSRETGNNLRVPALCHAGCLCGAL